MNDHSHHDDHDHELPEPGFVPHYELRLLYIDKPAFEPSKLAEALRRSMPEANIASIDGSAAIGRVEVGESIVEINWSDTPARPEMIETAVDQSWNWDEAAAVVPRCTAAISIVDHATGWREYASRADLLRLVTSVLLEQLPPAAVLSVPTTQFLEPATLLASFTETPRDPLFGLLNIRFFKLEGHEGGVDAEFDESVMDTVGLGALGLPDLQMHFKHLDPPLVAQTLYETALYLFENGPVIDTGHKVSGLAAGHELICRLEGSIADPYRLVVDLDPGRPYAAGR